MIFNMNMFKRVDSDKVIGNSFHNGYVINCATDINNVLGVYDKVGDFDDKTTHEWNYEIDGIVFSIYDYKEYHNVDDDEVIRYHVGTRTTDDTFYVLEKLKESGLNTAYSYSFFPFKY